FHPRRSIHQGSQRGLRAADPRRRDGEGRRDGVGTGAQERDLRLPARHHPHRSGRGPVVGDMGGRRRDRAGTLRSDRAPGGRRGPAAAACGRVAMTAEAERPWPDLLSRVIAREDLSADETAWAMDQVMTDRTTPEVLAGFLVGLATKGETVAEVRGLADAMLTHSVPVDVDGSDAVDVVGTGGDRLHTVNISTMASLVVAGAGVGVVKHGNRASSSSSGSADVLE